MNISMAVSIGWPCFIAGIVLGHFISQRMWRRALANLQTEMLKITRDEIEKQDVFYRNVLRENGILK